jgi:hypothetical protein
VTLTDPSGNPVANQPVVFKVTGNDGIITGASGSGAALTVNTDSNGHAQVSWLVGHRSGVSVNRVEASSAVSFVVADFTAAGIPGGAAQIVVDSGDNQSGVAGQALTFPLGVVVTDSGHNRIAGVPVTFSVITGGGSFNGAPNQIATTDTDGRALAVLTLGAGTDTSPTSNVVAANFPGNTSSAAAFTASALLAGDPTKTTISGDVLDNSNNPLPGVTMRLYQTNQGSNNNLPLQIGTPVQTDAQGHFVITNAPYGYFKLMADGTTAGGGTASYPTLEYDIITVAGQDNTVGTPIYLPTLDTVNKLCVDATHGGTLTLPDAPGFSLTVAPGSATFPGGARQGCVTVSNVHGDKVPMSPGFGQQPRYIVSIQPAGTLFNPPAAMTLPNVDGLAPRAKTEMYSYDHDLSMFLAIGTATVSDDGSVIASDPGVGVLKAGWHCGGDPNQTGTVGHCLDCDKIQGSAFIADPSKANTRCADAPNQYDYLTLDSQNDQVHINIDETCSGVCDGQGNCNPSVAGFSYSVISRAVGDAFGVIFNDVNTCMNPILRARIKGSLIANGLNISCNADVGTGCGKHDKVPSGNGGNSITVFTVNQPGCPTPDQTVFHEVIHSAAQDEGAPTADYHNNVTDAMPPDCRDIEYGCTVSCFQTADTFGDPDACTEAGVLLGGLPSDCGATCQTSNGVQTCPVVVQKR